MRMWITLFCQNCGIFGQHRGPFNVEWKENFHADLLEIGVVRELFHTDLMKMVFV